MFCYLLVEHSLQEINGIKLNTFCKSSSRLHVFSKSLFTEYKIFQTVLKREHYYLLCWYFEKSSKNALRKFRKWFLQSTLFSIWLIYKYPLFFLEKKVYEEYRTNGQEGASWKITRGWPRGQIARGGGANGLIAREGQRGQKIAQGGHCPFCLIALVRPLYTVYL